MVKSKKNSQVQGFRWTSGHIITYIVILIIILIIFKIITIKATYSPMFQWWNGNGGKQYNNFFNLFSVMASYDSNFIYLICNLFGTLYTNLSRAQILFLANRIFPLTKSFDPNNTNSSRFVTPRHIASDIRFAYIDGDRWYNNMIDTGVYTNIKYPNQSFKYDENITLTYKVDDKDPTIFWRQTTNNGTVGVYPSSNDLQGWRMLFQEWGSGDWENTAGPASPPFFVPNFDKDTSKVPKVNDEWFIDCEKNHPDNFFARYGIAPDSPLVISFVNGSYDDPNESGVVINANSVKNLINGHSASTPGGWIGYLEGMQSSSISYDMYINFIDSKYLSKNPAKEPGAGNISSCDQAGNIISATSSGVGLGSAGLFLLESNPVTAVFVMLIGASLGIAQYVNDNSKCKSQNPST
jgi:hypothetical protein